MLLHITTLEAPIVWIAFAAGIAIGAAIAFLFSRVKRHDRRERPRGEAGDAD